MDRDLPGPRAERSRCMQEIIGNGFDDRGEDADRSSDTSNCWVSVPFSRDNAGPAKRQSRTK
jgi:hypothetical protein